MIPDAEYADTVAADQPEVKGRLAEALPPISTTEDRALAAFLQDPGALDHALALALTPEDFTALGPRAVFAAMLSIRERGEQPNAIAVVDELDGVRDVIGPTEYISRLVNLLPDGEGAERYARRLKDNTVRRQAISTTQEFLSGAGTWSNGKLRESLAEFVERMSSLTAGSDFSGLPKAVCAADPDNEEPPGFLVEGLILSGETGFWTGDGGCFKTTTALALAAALAGGYRAFGRFATKQCPALFISEEDGSALLRNRLEAIVRGHGWDPGRVLPGVHLLAKAGLLLEDAGCQAHIRAEIQRVGAKLVVFDPYSGLTSTAENSNDEVKPIIRFWRSLNLDGVTVLVLHHAGKPQEGQRSIDRVRGASSLNQAARFAYMLRHTGALSITCLKMSRAEPLERFAIEPKITAAEDNATAWHSARLEYLRQEKADEDEAERFILSQLERYEPVNSSGLKDAAKGTGITAIEISNGIRRLHAVGKIDFEKGPKNSKNWRRATLPKESRQSGQGTLPSLPGACRATTGESARSWLPPFRGARSADGQGG